jgi:hypothetical protein
MQCKVCSFLKIAMLLLLKTMKRSVKLVIALLAVASGQQSLAQAGDPVSVLLIQDARLAAVAERLMSANRALCRRVMPATGIVIHSRDQYSAGSSQAQFLNGPVTIATVVDDSPAGKELRAGDGIVAIGSTQVATLHADAETGAPLRDAVFAALAEQPAEAPLTLTVSRDGAERTVTLPARPECRALVEIASGNGLDARSDGRVIQISYGLAAAASDEQLAVTFAHELAHVVLEHRRRLEAAGVSKGFFGELGRNQQLNRQVEVEADRMSVHLLANAGYDPRIATQFWRSPLGRRAGRGVLRSSTYPSAEARAQLIEREIAEYLGAGASPTWPGHLLARRDAPFD